MEKVLRRRYTLLDVPVDVFSKVQDLRDYLLQLMHNGKNNQIIFLTYSMLFKARRNNRSMQILNNAALVLPAEPSVLKGLSFVYKERFSAPVSINVVMSILSTLESVPNKSVYLLGGNSKKVIQVYQNLKISYPQVLFVGYHTGSMKRDQEERVIEVIRKMAPTLLLTSRGLNKADFWLSLHNKEFKPGITVFCRDCFDIFVGKQRRPVHRNLEDIEGFHFFRLLSYISYGFLLLANRFRARIKSHE